MTRAEIKNELMFGSSFDQARWLREISYQLACLNEREMRKNEGFVNTVTEKLINEEEKST